MTNIANKISETLRKNNLSIVTAESCTGGWAGKSITDLAGSSKIYDRGFITYSNQAKQDMLGVSSSTLDAYGAVSEDVAKEMAEGALKNSAADLSISITGIAGPSGGTENKPVGTVCFGWKLKGESATSKTKVFDGDRDTIRRLAVEFSLNGALNLIKS